MQPILVTVGIVSWNSETDLGACLESVRRQTHQPIELLVVDNASGDGTRSILERLTTPDERQFLDNNRGFSAGHNLAIERSRGDFYLCLNPDVTLSSRFVEHMVARLLDAPTIGSASGKLLRADARGTIDSAGIRMLPSQRHLDRGAGEPDGLEFDQPALIFGASGAAAFYRRTMLDDVRVSGEVFDPDFFAYREDADLAWRAQLMGWKCLYVPEAVATHVRRVTPERRSALPADINRWSVRNRFLLRLKNQSAGHFWCFLGPALVRDLQVVGYVLLSEHSSIPGLIDVIRLLPGAWRKRREIMAKRRVKTNYITQWFAHASLPLT